MNKRWKIFLLIIIVIALNLGADQFTKQLARDNLKTHEYVEVVGQLFVLTLAENDGAFLSLGSGFPEFIKLALLYVLPIIAVIGMIIFIFLNKKLTIGQVIALATVIGGGIGNLLDRLFRGGWVTDFMNFGFGSVRAGLRTGILNVADLSLTFGVIALLIITSMHEKKLEHEKKQNSINGEEKKMNSSTDETV
ncbi:MAG: signal peptidase II [Spirochaetales bacterium]|nr:signal peptidase II [Spirochaetales bacterium]